MPYEMMNEDFEADTTFGAFKPLLNIDDWNSDEEGWAPKNEYEARQLRAFDEIRKKYFNIKREWYMHQIQSQTVIDNSDVLATIERFRVEFKLSKNYEEKLEHMF